MANEFYLKIDTIDGESTKDGYKDQIEIGSFNWGAQQQATTSSGTGGGGGKVDMQSFQFMAKASKASPKLMLACATGQHIASAILTCRKAGGKQEAYLKYTLSNVLISSFNTSGSEGGDPVPTESFAIAFSKIEMEYKPQDDKGGVGAAITTGYDLKKMAKV